MKELEYIAQQGLYLMVGSMAIAIKNSSELLNELSLKVETTLATAIALGEQTYQEWCQESSDNVQTSSKIPSIELQHRLFHLAGRNWEIVERLLVKTRKKYPNHSEVWYWEKTIGDLESNI